MADRPAPGSCAGWWPCRFGGPSGSMRRDCGPTRHDPGVTGGTWPAAAFTGVVSCRVGVLVPGRGGECDRQGGCLARGPEHRDGVGGDVGDAVLALLAGEGQPGVWTDAERGQVVVLAGDHACGGARALVY